MPYIQLSYPQPDFKIKTENDKQYIFDVIRKKYIVLTREEWVRQNFIAYLVKVLKYPVSLISVEKKITIGNMSKRYDVVVYDKNFSPFLLAECKQPGIPVNENTLMQLLNYQNVVHAKYWVITNGADTYCAYYSNGEVKWRDELPGIEK